jgi:predicted transcriptional regulator
MNELYDSIKCLCESQQRIQILNALEGTQMDLRSLKSELESPRTTLQRNLSVLEQQGWIEEIRSGYTTTTTGCLILKEVVAMDETIHSMAPFLEAVEASTEIDISQLHAPLVTVPESKQPNAPMKRLLDTLEGAERVRGVLPVVSSVLVELSRHADAGGKPEPEFVVSRDALTVLYEQYADERPDTGEISIPMHGAKYVYEDDLPYGLVISGTNLVLIAYDDIGRMQAIVESDSGETIEWGEQVYENYRNQSRQLSEADVPFLGCDVRTAD